MFAIFNPSCVEPWLTSKIEMESVMNTSKNHQHSPGCGHTAVQHQGHTDYLERGHLVHQEGSKVEEHKVEVDAAHPDKCTGDHEIGGHPKGHVHGPNCGHEAVPHGNYSDYLVI